MAKAAPRPVREELLPLAERMREAIAIIGTQADAARAGNVSPRQLRAYVSGRSKPDIHVAANIASAAGLTIEWMLNGVGPKLLKESIEFSYGAPETQPGDDIRAYLRTRLASACDAAGVDFSHEDEDSRRIVSDTLRLIMVQPSEDRLRVAIAVADAQGLALIFARQQTLKKASRSLGATPRLPTGR